MSYNIKNPFYRSSNVTTVPSDKLKEMQEKMKTLRALLKECDEVLGSIASEKPEEVTEEYWLGLSHADCADVLAADTRIARTMQEKLKKEMGKR